MSLLLLEKERSFRLAAAMAASAFHARDLGINELIDTAMIVLGTH